MHSTFGARRPARYTMQYLVQLHRSRQCLLLYLCTCTIHTSHVSLPFNVQSINYECKMQLSKMFTFAWGKCHVCIFPSGTTCNIFGYETRKWAVSESNLTAQFFTICLPLRNCSRDLFVSDSNKNITKKWSLPLTMLPFIFTPELLIFLFCLLDASNLNLKYRLLYINAQWQSGIKSNNLLLNFIISCKQFKLFCNTKYENITPSN